MDERTPGESAKRAARVGFAIAVAVFVVGTPLSWWQGHEPYPALVMPAFPLYKATVVRTEAHATVHFDDGASAPVSFYEMLPPTPLEPTSVVTTAFRDDAWTRDPQTVAWVRDRLGRQFPGRNVAAMDIVWQLTTYSADSPRREPVQTVRVEFA